MSFVRAAVDAGPALDRALDVTVHFHPDRLVDGVPLLAHLAADGVYRSQFETGTSNGGLTARPGGDRWRWEQRMFGGAYDDGPACERPKYGALNYRRHPVGGAVRFGSSHLRLAPHVLDRVTFCYPDSVTEPTNFGTAQCMPLISLAERDTLDDHIEAHIHGPLRLAEDVAEVVLDPSFDNTPVADAAARLPVPVRWHPGFRLHTDELAHHPTYRGPHIVALGTALAENGWLTPRVLGDAARSGAHDPQDLKKVWHCVARFGYAWIDPTA